MSDARKFITSVIEEEIRKSLNGLSGEARKYEYARLHYRMLGADLKENGNVYCKDKIIGKHLGVTDDWKISFKSYQGMGYSVVDVVVPPKTA